MTNQREAKRSQQNHQAASVMTSPSTLTIATSTRPSLAHDRCGLRLWGSPAEAKAERERDQIKKRLTVDASALVDQRVADITVAAAREVISSVVQGSWMAMLALCAAMPFQDKKGPSREHQKREQSANLNSHARRESDQWVRFCGRWLRLKRFFFW